MITVYNKGKREWRLGDDVNILPGRVAELDEKKAKMLLDGYPNDFIKGGPGGESQSARQLKKENEKLKAELEALKTPKKRTSTKKDEDAKA